MNILLCEDEPGIAEFVRQGLQEEDFLVDWAADGSTALDHVFNKQYDILLLDIRLPDISGLEVCRRIRLHHPTLPILMLTALDSVEDRVAGLRAGADDYLPKPFAFEELLARISALHRRAQTEGHGEVEIGDLKLDPIHRSCQFEGKEVELTSRQFDLLAYLIARPNKALTRESIYRDVWQLPFEPNTNIIDVYVNYLRQALAKSGCNACIESVRGVGYRFLAHAEPADS